METFAARVARLRTKKGLTQKEIAKALGVPVSTYKEWEYGRSIQAVHIYVLMADIIGISVRALLSGELESETEDVLENLDGALRHIERAKKTLMSSL